MQTFAPASEDVGKREDQSSLEGLTEAFAGDQQQTMRALPFLFQKQDSDTSASAEVQSNHHKELENKSFVQQVLHGPFRSSIAHQFWQLAAAPYRAISNNGNRDYVGVQGRVWEVIAENPATETLVVGGRLGKTSAPVLELGFRGTVTEDAYGNASWANWCSNLHAAAVPLQGLDVDNSAVHVHKGFRDSYLAVSSRVISWLENSSKSGSGRPSVRVAGHSLGGALATLAAVDVKQRGWEVEGVVTFGSPKVGMDTFNSLYQELGLHHRTVRFANQCDPVPLVPPSTWGFEHVVEEHYLGLPTLIGNPHAIEGSSKSYYHTLHDEVDGREVPHLALRTLNCMVQHGIATRAATVLVPCAVAARAVDFMASCKLIGLNQTKQVLQVDIALLRQDVATLAEGMASAVQAVKKSVREIQQWEWLLDMETLIQIVTRYKDKLHTWQQGVPQWFIQYQLQLRRILEAAKVELHDIESKLALNLVMLYLQAARFLIAAMTASGACPTDVQKELGDFIAESKGLVSNCFHFDIPPLNDILRLSPSSDDFTLPVDVPEEVRVNLTGLVLKLCGLAGLQFGKKFLGLLKWSGRTHLEGLELKLGQHEAEIIDIDVGTILSQLASNLPENLLSLAVDFHGCSCIKQASLLHFVNNMPKSLTSLSLNFGSCLQITDSFVQQLADELPKNLEELNLDLAMCKQVSDPAVQQLAHKMPQGLKSLTLGFGKCRQIKDTSLQQLAHHMPKDLAHLSLDFQECSQLTDASLLLLARNLPPSLSSLSFDFRTCGGITDACAEEITGMIKQKIKSVFLIANQFTHGADREVGAVEPDCRGEAGCNGGLLPGTPWQLVASPLVKLVIDQLLAISLAGHTCDKSGKEAGYGSEELATKVANTGADKYSDISVRGPRSVIFKMHLIEQNWHMKMHTSCDAKSRAA
eukprot:Skav216853  [mRNA]  locus=scaffold1042:35015:39951:+ [translate_table: standard]